MTSQQIWFAPVRLFNSFDHLLTFLFSALFLLCIIFSPFEQRLRYVTVYTSDQQIVSRLAKLRTSLQK